MPPDQRTDHTPWTITHDPVSVDVVEFRKISGKKVHREEPLHDKLTAMIAHQFDGSKQQAMIQSREAQKPEWFIEAESDARSFMSSLGFDNLGEIYLIEGHLDVHGLNVNAYHDTLTRRTLASEAKFNHILQAEGIITATSVLVHELTHNTAPRPERITLQQYADSTTEYEQRNGWLISGKHGDQGSFLEEAFAEYAASLYRRQSSDPYCHLLPKDYTPTPDLPAHLQTGAIVAGPDAHALELIAWGVEQRVIMSADSFIGLCFDARKSITYASATREVIQAINSLSPGLYSYLKKLEYSKENWATARDIVYEIVTH
ncbi:MAG: hypothetical protein JWM07_769 [Candidatus Saccharibacteria bacterium]|jgi:hypothetical protein|nr:hypothetical protein [Candidatus Saccharibacteria bacterium]